MASTDVMPRKLWEHSNPKSTIMWDFILEVNRQFGTNIQTFDELYKWSCKSRVSFYDLLWKKLPWIHEGSYERVVDEALPISSVPVWFEGVRANWAENILYSYGGAAGARSTVNKEDGKVAFTEIREGNTEVRNYTWAELRRNAGELAAALKARGVGKGDRVVCIGGHSEKVLRVQLAITWLGGMFSSSSTDMGASGLLQRTAQVNPKFVFFDEGALYNGKVVDLRDKIQAVVEGMKDCDQFQSIVVLPRFQKPYDTSSIPKTERLESFIKNTPDLTPPPFKRVEFQDPAMIFFSSGTTGIPKAIVHGVGALLISFSREQQLHRNSTAHDVGLQYTTTGWVMYFSSIGLLLAGGRVVAYDGSPFLPDRALLLRLIQEQRVTVFGTSPRWLMEIIKSKIVPREAFDLSSLTKVLSTGMVLPEEVMEWFYDVGFPKEVQLCNMTGGTDIAGCFALENPISPLYVGGIMGLCLGVDVGVFDYDLPEGATGKYLPVGRSGDLVATAAFPNMPVMFWNDGPGPAPGPKYRSAYFSRFENAWAQGDFCCIQPLTGAFVMQGRSDGVLNPSGVRFGSSDIYNVLEKHFKDTVSESICVGQRRPKDTDETVVLFLLMKPGVKLTPDLLKEIKDKIAKECTKRHVPKYTFEMPEVPVTVNGKKVEMPVKHIISGKTVKPSGTLLNPESLQYFYQFQKIEELAGPKAKL